MSDDGKSNAERALERFNAATERSEKNGRRILLGYGALVFVTLFVIAVWAAIW
jgi:hypothetical protein